MSKTRAANKGRVYLAIAAGVVVLGVAGCRSVRAFHWAVASGRLTTVRNYLRFAPWLASSSTAADDDMPDWRVTAVARAIGIEQAQKRREMVALLLSKQADPNASTVVVGPPLRQNAQDPRDPEVCEALLEAGADPDVVTYDSTAISRAVDTGFFEGARMMARHSRQLPAACRLALLGDRSTLAAAVLKKADLVKEDDGAGWTPLHYAAALGDTACMRVLLDAGAPARAVDSSGTTALHLAAGLASPRAALLLLEAGASATYIDGYYATPLHVAAGKSLEVVRLLVSRGVSLNQVDMSNRTPLDVAVEFERGDIASFLRSCGARRSANTSP